MAFFLSPLRLGLLQRTPLAVVVLSLFAAGLAGCASRPEPAPTQIDRVLVRKGERILQLLQKGAVYREYRISLGDQPLGHKLREGDERTPEGNYVLDWRNPNSSFHKSLHVSYPNELDRAIAQAHGASAGGMIMIHGLPNWLTSPQRAAAYRNRDWTNGCIAVGSNEEMEEIWALVRDGTPITILP